MKEFLWGGTRKARVKWSNICLPNDRGGLVVPYMVPINDIHILKNIWNICGFKEGLWVNWYIQSY